MEGGRRKGKEEKRKKEKGGKFKIIINLYLIGFEGGKNNLCDFSKKVIILSIPIFCLYLECFNCSLKLKN